MDRRETGHTRSDESWGGSWTETKLDNLESYLDAYTTALKSTAFNLLYIDAFAGTGKIQLHHGRGAKDFLVGSSERAMRIENKSFDRLVFIEKDPKRCGNLMKLRNQYPSRDVKISNSDANIYLRNLQEDWKRWRGVLFLDPFATEVEWATIEAIANFKALDMWILFPVSAIARILPRSRRPEDVSKKWAERLTRVFGNDSWRGLYSECVDLFGDNVYERGEGIYGLSEIYKRNLANLFGSRFLPKSKVFCNSRNSPLFEFLFCVGNSRGIDVAKRIANHILDN